MKNSRRMFRNDVRPLAGDVIGFSRFDALGWLICLGTGTTPFRGPSHVGIVADYSADTPLLLFESTSQVDEPCAIRGRRTRGVQAHGLYQRMAAHRGRVWHFPLIRPLDDAQSRRLRAYLHASLGVAYDVAGAAHSRHTPLAWLYRRLFQEEDLGLLYCPELVAAALRTAGRLKSKNVSAYSPIGLIRVLRRQGALGQARRIRS